VPRLGFLTFGLMRAPSGDPAVRGFEIRIAATYSRAADAPGFVGSYAEGIAARGVRPQRWVDPAYDERCAITVTCWTDLESVHAFAFGPGHAAVMRRGHAWMERGDWPTHVAWWIGDDETPDLLDAARRYDLLDAQGPTPDAFTFGTPFDPAGDPAPSCAPTGGSTHR
jgi:hypothetical protein